jgi:DHA1 family bicyclomycin/chloramphenicol resistance-like MFS transporter
VLASLGCALSPSILVLDLLRLVQGLCGAAGIVLARAIVRDRWSGLEAARIYAGLMTALSLGPILAPTVGGGLLHLTDWRGLFVVLAGWGVALLVGAAIWVPETLPASGRRPAGLGRTLRVMRRLLSDRVFTGYTVGAGLSFGALFSYIAGSSFVFQDVYGVSPQVYALLFGLNGVALLGASAANHRLQERVGPVRLLRAGMLTMLAGGALVVLAVVADAGLGALVAALFIAVAGIGFVPSNGVALALEHHGADAGTASALIGVVQFTIGGLAAPLPGLAGATALPMALGVLGFAVAALVTVRVVVGSDRVEHAGEPA